MNETITLAELLERAAARHNNASGRRLADIAQQAGIEVSHATLNRIRNGTYKSTPSDSTIRAIAHLAGVPEESAFTAAGATPPESLYTPPAEAERLDQRQRKALDELIRAFAPRPVSSTTKEERALTKGLAGLGTWLEIQRKRESGESLSADEEAFLEIKRRDELEVDELEGLHYRIDLLDRGRKLYLNSLVDLLLEEQDEHGTGTEEEQEPRTQAGGTKHSGTTGGDRSRSGAPMNEELFTRERGARVGKAITTFGRGKSEDLNPDDQDQNLDESSPVLELPRVNPDHGDDAPPFDESKMLAAKRRKQPRRDG